MVLAYATMGPDSNILSPLTASASGNPSPDSPTYLFLRQEELLTVFDAACPNPIETSLPLQPGLKMLTVKAQLLEKFREIEQHGTMIADAANRLLRESRKRGKREVGEVDSVAADDDDEHALEKRSRVFRV